MNERGRCPKCKEVMGSYTTGMGLGEKHAVCINKDCWFYGIGRLIWDTKEAKA